MFERGQEVVYNSPIFGPEPVKVIARDYGNQTYYVQWMDDDDHYGDVPAEFVTPKES